MDSENSVVVGVTQSTGIDADMQLWLAKVRIGSGFSGMCRHVRPVDWI